MTLREYFNSGTAPRQIDFARTIGCAPSYLGRMITGNRKAGAKYIPKIVRATKGKVSAKDLNPQLIGALQKLIGK